jgi:hypothetical protein
MSSLTALVLSLMMFLTSCSIKNDYAEFHGPTSQTHVPPTKFLCIEIQDARTQQDIGYIKNLIGMKTGRILSKTPVSSIFYESIADVLATQSITIAPSPLKLFVTIKECFATYSTGLLITKATAKIILDVYLVNEEGVSLYTGTIKGLGTESPVFFYSGKNTGAALSKALNHALDSLCGEITPHITKSKMPS